MNIPTKKQLKNMNSGTSAKSAKKKLDNADKKKLDSWVKEASTACGVWQ